MNLAEYEARDPHHGRIIWCDVPTPTISGYIGYTNEETGS